MKVILLEDVAKIGKKFEVKEVSNGFALNFLLPHKQAQMATAQAIKDIESKKEAHIATLKDEQTKVEALVAKIQEQGILIKASSNEEGKLFAGIDAKGISEAIKEQSGEEIKAELIILENPLKEVGKHQVKIALGEKQEELTINIEKEEK